MMRYMEMVLQQENLYLQKSLTETLMDAQAETINRNNWLLK